MAVRNTRQHLVRDAELAGSSRLPNLVSAAQGCLQPPIGLSSDGETLRCAPTWDSQEALTVPATLLFDFMALADAPTENLAAFAARFGMLGVCSQHGRPIGHTERVTLAVLLRDYNPGCRPMYDAFMAQAYEERADDWRAWARRFRLVFERVNELKRGLKTGRELDPMFLEGFARLPEVSPVTRRTSGRAALWAQVSGAMNVWLGDCGLGPVLVASRDGNTSIEMSGAPQFAFPILALQLLMFVTGAEQVATCSACGSVYPAARRPQTGRDNYCTDCGRKAANRAAIRRFRERAKSESGTAVKRTSQPRMRRK